jgi:hypothetical protein
MARNFEGGFVGWFLEPAAPSREATTTVYMIGYECWGVLCPTIPVRDEVALPISSHPARSRPEADI